MINQQKIILSNLQKLERATALFNRFRKNMQSEQEKCGTVQAFEFCYELAWKIMRRVLHDRGQETGSPRDTFRKAALENIIEDPTIWFDFQQKRNVTVHTYEEENLTAVIIIFEPFAIALQKLITKLYSLYRQ